MSGFKVTEAAMRPADTVRRCFYCRVPVGSDHDLSQCVLVKRRVVVRMEIESMGLSHEYEIEVPAGWSADDIEFHRNYSSWCASNALEELPDEILDRMDGADDDGGPCLCGVAHFSFVRDVEGERGKPFSAEGR